MYQECTRSIQISVEPFYVDEQSSPEQGRFVFGYRIQIDNKSAETVQLISRHWRITDSLGRTMEVRGPGVVGKQPVLRPGERFEYTSGTPLTTSSGIMVGSYQMVTTSGEQFDVCTGGLAGKGGSAEVKLGAACPKGKTLIPNMVYSFKVGADEYAKLTGAVPEPQTWAMMLAGFGAVGAAMRRRRKPMPRALV